MTTWTHANHKVKSQPQTPTKPFRCLFLSALCYIYIQYKYTLTNPLREPPGEILTQMYMEGHCTIVENSTGGSGGTPGSSRWNPTKEQINMLENLYMQGMRTPSAEQIQQITISLRAFGHIEGKNVFYWFQNHKARQRQKQKQESLAYINRFIHRTCQPVFPSRPCSNG